MGETAEQMIQFYEGLKKISACLFAISFFSASFLTVQGKLWMTVRMLKNEKRKRRRKKQPLLLLFMVIYIIQGKLGYAQAMEKIELEEAIECTEEWKETAECAEEKWIQEMELSASAAWEEWFSGEEDYKIFVKVIGKKPDQICFSWSEGKENRTSEVYETIWEEEGIYEYELIFEQEELESMVQIWAVTQQEITCEGEWQVKIDRKPPQSDVIFEYREGEQVIQKRWMEIPVEETIYFQNQAEITVYVRDTGAGIAYVTFEIGEMFVEAERGETAQIDGEVYDAYHSIFYAPMEGKISKLSVTDYAGNCILLEQEDSTKIVIDQIAPVCQMFFLPEAIEEGNIIFFRDMAEVHIQILEKYWKEQEVPVWVNGEVDLPDEGDWFWKTEELYEKVMFFTEEGRYQIQVGSVFDLSGNEMEQTEGKVFVVDRTAPRLKEIEIEVDGRIEEGIWYTKNGKVKGSLCIEEAWFEPQKIRLYLWNRETEEMEQMDLNWDWSEGEARASFQIQEIVAEGSYQFIVSGTDQAGNPMICEATNDSVGYSEIFVVDHTQPRVTLFEIKKKKNEKNGILYFQENITGSFLIEEMRGLKNCQMMQSAEDGTWKPVRVQWQGEKGIFALDKREGKTKLLICAEDFAGNQLVLQENITDLYQTEDGIVSKEMIVDQTRPRVQILYQTEDNRTISLEQWQKEKEWKKEKLKMTLRVMEENFELSQWKIEVVAYDKKGNMEQSEEESVRNANRQCTQWMEEQKTEQGWKKGTWHETQIMFQEEANYKITIQMKDFSGNVAVFEEVGGENSEGIYQAFFTIDQTAPFFLEKEQYQKEDQTVLEEYPYQDYTYFSDQKVNILLKVCDRISGVKMIRYCFADVENQEWEEAKTLEKGMDDMISLIQLPVGFQGAVWVQAVDGQGVIGEKKKLDAVFIQEKAEAEKSSALVIAEEQNPYMRKDGMAYYAQEIALSIHAEDQVSGIKRLRCFVNGQVWAEEICSQKKERTFLIQKKLLLTEQDLTEEGIFLEVWMETNSGYQRRNTRRYLIDAKKPTITVTYDREEEAGIFDRGRRTAYVTVEDEHLDGETVTLTIETQKGEDVIQNPWEISEEEGKIQYNMTLLFEKEDAYTITVAGSDRSGNREEKTEEMFILDYTSPKITIKKEFPKSEKENFYRTGGKICVFIQEEHFMAEGVFLELSGSDEKGEVWRENWDGVWIPVEGGYQSEKEIEKEGCYKFQICCQDQAGNRSDMYEMEPIVIDRTAPEILIENLEDHSANRGKVEPVILLSDSYLDRQSLEILCIGEKWGEKKLVYEKAEEEGKDKIIFFDFPYEKEEDDLYTMDVRIKDEAGNRSEKRIRFSVNRFGSVYTLSEETKTFVDQYYQREGQTLQVIETNVNVLEENAIFCSREGEIRQLKKGKDYQVHLKGGKESWKQYVYEIGKQNFHEEGVYQITFVSTDQAGNFSENQRKGEEILFVIDRSSPTVTISGIKRGGRYKAKECSVWIDVVDNIGLKKVSLFLNDVLWEEWGQGEWEQNKKLTIKEKDAEQKLSVVTEDFAGNRSVYIVDHFLISSDSWIQFWHSYQRYAVIGVLMASILLILILLKKYQKKKFEFKR